jgi:hypothetical protein
MWQFGLKPQKRELDSTNVLQNTSFAFATPPAGQTQLVAALGSAHIVVLQLVVVVGPIVSCKFQSAGSDITGLFPFQANGGMVLPYSGHGWFQTNINEALNVTFIGGGGAVNLVWCPSN